MNKKNINIKTLSTNFLFVVDSRCQGQNQASDNRGHTLSTLGTIQILRNQKGGWVGKAKCLRLLTRRVGGCG